MCADAARGMILLVVASYVLVLVASFPSPDMHGPQDVKNGIKNNASSNKTRARLYQDSLLSIAAMSNTSIAADPLADVIADVDLSTPVASASNTSGNEVSDEVSEIIHWLNIVDTTAPASNDTAPADSSSSFENRDPSTPRHVPESQSLLNVARPELREAAEPALSGLQDARHNDDPREAAAGRRARRQVAEPGLSGLQDARHNNEPREAVAGRTARRQIEEPTLSGLQDALRQGEGGSFGYTNSVKRKVLSMMLQSLYSAQERLWPLEPIVKKYEHLTPYRMAFIFLKLDQLVYECHSIYMYLQRQKLNMEMSMTRRLQLYSHLVRRNIDVTYLVDYITERVPRDQMTRIRQWLIRQEQEKLLGKKRDWDRTTKQYVSRPNINR